MTTQPDPQRITELYRMLFEMASGKFSFRVMQSGENDSIDRLGILLSTVAEQMQHLISKTTATLPIPFQNIILSTLVCNSDLRICSYSPDIAMLLSYSGADLIHQKFGALLAKNSHQTWAKVEQRLASGNLSIENLQLYFNTADGKVWPSYCTVSRLIGTDVGISISMNSFANGLSAIGTNLVPKSGSEAIIGARDYILHNLDKELPSAAELARKFGTNEFQLKDGFRKLLHTSIYQFYNDNRLKLAFELISQTDASLKDIAMQSGFNGYVNFAKAFKKKFGFPPSDLQRSGSYGRSPEQY